MTITAPDPITNVSPIPFVITSTAPLHGLNGNSFSVGDGAAQTLPRSPFGPREEQEQGEDRGRRSAFLGQHGQNIGGQGQEKERPQERAHPLARADHLVRQPDVPVPAYRTRPRHTHTSIPLRMIREGGVGRASHEANHDSDEAD